MKKFPKDFYSDEEFFEIAWRSNYFVALLVEELGKEQFDELSSKIYGNPQPDGMTIITIWMMFAHYTEEEILNKYEDDKILDIHTPEGESYEGDEVLH